MVWIIRISIIFYADITILKLTDSSDIITLRKIINYLHVCMRSLYCVMHKYKDTHAFLQILIVILYK